MNAYITASSDEKVQMTFGPEFGDDAGNWALIVCALYGLKSAGASFHAHLGCFMQGLGHEPCLIDPDVCTKAQVVPDDKYKY